MSYSFIQFLLEKRSHADINPKVSVNKAIGDAFRDAVKTKSKIADVYNFFVSMTSVDKLGINPGSDYDTPLGIYAYPGQFVYKKAAAGDELTAALPFAGELAHANIFTAKGNIINIGEITEDEVAELYKKIADVYHEYAGNEFEVDNREVQYFIKTAASKAKVSSLPGGRLWYVTMRVATDLMDGSAPVAWNKLFRKIGVDGVVDMGKGIIHTNEPTQAVFFSIKAIDNVKRVNNKYSPNAVKGRINQGVENREVAAQVAKMTEQQVLDKIQTAVDCNFLKYVRNQTRAIMLAALDQTAFNIQYFKNPPEDIQMRAVQDNSRAIRYIDNPSPAVQWQAIDGRPENFKWIKKPTEQVKQYYKQSKG